MNKLINSYNQSLENLTAYFNIDGFSNYVIQECPNDYWQIEGDYIYYGTDQEDFDYSCEFKVISRKEDITAVLVESDFGDDDYWNIFYTDKEVKEDE